MATRNGTAHVVTTTRKYKDRVYRTHLLRRSYREDGAVKNETLGNLSHLPNELVKIIRRSLQGETFVPLAQTFEISRSRAHGHVEAVMTTLQRLGLASLIASKSCRERDLVLAMVASRILAPHTKLATTRWWHTTTLAEDFGVADANEDDLYAAMDWLLQRQDAIQKKLGRRHLSAGGLVLYDLSSSYFEGNCCPLAKRGYSRDGKHGMLQVNYGLLTDPRGCPVAVSVHEGNTADSTTFLPEVQRLRTDFGIEQMVMVGDRGMISQKAIDEMQGADGIGWITASRACRFANWPSRDSCSSVCLMSAICLSLAHRTFPASVWSHAAIRNWPGYAATNAKTCSRPQKPTSRRSRPAFSPAGLPARPRSVCGWARSSINTRLPNISN